MGGLAGRRPDQSSAAPVYCTPADRGPSLHADIVRQQWLRRRWEAWGRDTLGLAATVVLCLVAGCRADARGSTAAAASPPGPPSIVLVSIDTLRADHVGAYGAKTGATPNLDALAAEGVLFEGALIPVPVTLPAHASM
jgi:hypothetical protein